jgi:3-hydroxyacyl-CoA dehydrogenase/enoyl-CoA hydratase/3-hydroxybutyryl-CoA epimerase
MTESIRVEHRPDGVAVLRFDLPGEPVNVLRSNFAEEFDHALGEVLGTSGVRAVVFTSGKPDTFIAGADIKMLEALRSAEDAAEVVRTGQSALGRLADFGKPVVAAIDGACLGGGLEVALACQGRVASQSPKTRLGFPEVQLGILPGLGGTQRTPRLIGVQAALDLLLTGKQIDARRAYKLGLVDEVVPAPILIEVAARLALEFADNPRRRDELRRRVWSPLSKAALTDVLLVENPVGRKILFDQARKQTLAKTRGNYPAPERILEVVRIGLAKGLERGLSAEAEAFGQLAVTPEARELMGIFLATQELKKDSGVDDPSQKPASVSQIAVLGAGLMGAGIAYVSVAQGGYLVRLKDRDDAAVGRGLKTVRGLYEERVSRRRMTPAERDREMCRVTPSLDYAGFRGAEIVIEAVFEDLGLKRRMLRDIEEHGHPSAIFASNTSSLPIHQIAAEAAHPERVVGMHYFSPVNKMPLLEVIVTDKTAAWVTATAVEVGKKQGKTVIVVNDGPGFYTTRIVAPYMNEAAFLLSEGVPVDVIDRALVDWGFPVGPVALLDEVGIDVAEKVGKILQAAFGERMAAPAGIHAVIADGRQGRKNGRGFYRYDAPKHGHRPVDTSVYSVLGVTPGTSLSASAIVERCALMMINEAARCHGEGIVRSSRDADIGAVFGLGFPPFRGGPCRYLDAVGAPEIVRRLEAYRSELGPRFTPAPALIQMAEARRKFHGPDRQAPGSAK